MKLKQVIDVCNFLSIKIKDNTDENFIMCAACGGSDGFTFAAKTDDGYCIATNQCDCGETTVLYCKYNQL